MPASAILVGSVLLVLLLDLAAHAATRGSAPADWEREGWITDTIPPSLATTEGEEAWASEG